jgi:hypothetical protein
VAFTALGRPRRRREGERRQGHPGARARSALACGSRRGCPT